MSVTQYVKQTSRFSFRSAQHLLSAPEKPLALTLSSTSPLVMRLLAPLPLQGASSIPAAAAASSRSSDPALRSGIPPARTLRATDASPPHSATPSPSFAADAFPLPGPGAAACCRRPLPPSLCPARSSPRSRILNAQSSPPSTSRPQRRLSAAP